MRDRDVVFVFICLFNLQEYMCFLFFDGLLWVAYGTASSFLSCLIFFSPSPHPAQLRLHLSLAKEAPNPADPLPREKNQRTEGGKR